MLKKYTKTFKIEAVRKAVSRNPGTSINSIARSLNVKITTLHGWIKAMDNKLLREDPPSRGGIGEKNPCHWSSEEKLQAIMDTARLPQEEVSQYCRKKGIFPHHIDQWKAEFVKPTARPENDTHLKQLKKEVNRLNGELNRKEKALAEAAALLMLKKKAQALWGDGEVDYFQS